MYCGGWWHLLLSVLSLSSHGLSSVWPGTKQGLSGLPVGSPDPDVFCRMACLEVVWCLKLCLGVGFLFLMQHVSMKAFQTGSAALQPVARSTGTASSPPGSV